MSKVGFGISVILLFVTSLLNGSATPKMQKESFSLPWLVDLLKSQKFFGVKNGEKAQLLKSGHLISIRSVKVKSDLISGMNGNQNGFVVNVRSLSSDSFSEDIHTDLVFGEVFLNSQQVQYPILSIKGEPEL